jgi:hypothetical protein
MFGLIKALSKSGKNPGGQHKFRISKMMRAQTQPSVDENWMS